MNTNKKNTRNGIASLRNLLTIPFLLVCMSCSLESRYATDGKSAPNDLAASAGNKAGVRTVEYLPGSNSGAVGGEAMVTVRVDAAGETNQVFESALPSMDCGLILSRLSNYLKTSGKTMESLTVTEVESILDTMETAVPVTETRTAAAARKKVAGASVPVLGDASAYLNWFKQNGRSGDISIYWGFAWISHASIWDARNKQFFHSGDPKGAGYLTDDEYLSLIQGNECHAVRVNSPATSDQINAKIDYINSVVPKKYNLTPSSRLDYSNGTYCNQLPWLVWYQLGREIASSYNSGTRQVVTPRYVVEDYWILWWHIHNEYWVNDITYVTIGWENRTDSLIMGNDIYIDNDTYEICRK